MELSNIIAGTMTWGAWGKKYNPNEMSTLIKVCVNNGISTFDHADIYGGHTTEEEFGKGFLVSGVNRQDIQLISKCGIKYISENRNYGIKHYDYSKEYIIWSVENSLINLKTDYLDVLLLHRPSPLMRGEIIAETIQGLINEGKVLKFGVSNFTQSQIELIEKHIKIDYNQIQFSATHFEALTNGMLDMMQVKDITPMAWNPLGVYFKQLDKQTKSLRIVVSKLVEKYNVTEDIILLKWIQMHPANILPVVGTADPDKIKLLPKLNSFELELEEWFTIWTESMGEKVP